MHTVQTGAQKHEHHMAAIAAGGLTPMKKAPIFNEGRDARVDGNMLAQQTIALARTQDQTWQNIAWSIIGLTTDGRAAYITALDKNLRAMKDEVEEFHSMEQKAARKLVNSATVNISRCRTIANAFNGGASSDGMKAHYNVDDPTGLGFIMIYNYAQTFSKSAAGRKPDLLLVKLGKWIEAQKKGLSVDNPKEDHDVMQELISLYNRLTPSE